MKVIKHTVPPIVPPHTTFDLLGLTYPELKLIRLALGRTTTADDKKAGLIDRQGMALFVKIAQTDDDATS